MIVLSSSGQKKVALKKNLAAGEGQGNIHPLRQALESLKLNSPSAVSVTPTTTTTYICKSALARVDSQDIPVAMATKYTPVEFRQGVNRTHKLSERVRLGAGCKTTIFSSWLSGGAG